MVKEVLSILHGFLGTIFLMGFSGAFAELIELTNAGIRRIKLGTLIMFVASILLDMTGAIIYVYYRAPVPESARSKILAGPVPWVHTVLFELKEFVAVYVPVILVVAVYMAWHHAAEIGTNKTIRMMLTALLVLATLVTLLTFGLGAYVTKVQPL